MSEFHHVSVLLEECIEGLAILLLNNRQRAHRLREHGELTTVYRQLAGVGEECKALYTNEVADIQELLEYGVVECGVALRADVITTNIDLNTAC